MESTKNREMNISAMISAPVERVWKVWTEPDHIIHWWGPAGFTSTIHTMEVKEDGEWRMTMHGPDGTDFPNRSLFKEIVPFKKIVF